MSPKKTVKTLVRRGREGLTLVEIMVVIAILGVLMTVLGGSLLGALDDANVDATKLTMNRVDQALQIYASRNRGKFPSTSEGLSAAARHMTDGAVPKDAWGNDFQYFSPGSNSSAPYELISLGKDGESGGEDTSADIQSWNLNGDD